MGEFKYVYTYARATDFLIVLMASLPKPHNSGISLHKSRTCFYNSATRKNNSRTCEDHLAGKEDAPSFPLQE